MQTLKKSKLSRILYLPKVSLKNKDKRLLQECKSDEFITGRSSSHTKKKVKVLQQKENGTA